MTYRKDAGADPGAVPPPGCPAHTGGPAHGGPVGGRGAAVPLYGADFAADPHAFYARLRAMGPIAPVELSPGVGAYLVTSYTLALEVQRDTERFAKDPRNWRALNEGEVPQDCPVLPMLMYRPNALFTDGEEHARFRGAINDSLGRVDVHALSEFVERSADMLIDAFAGRGEADLLSEYAAIIPLLVFNQLFGSPPEKGRELVRTVTALFDVGPESARANDQMLGYMADLVAVKRREPGPDVTSWMIAHPSRLTDEELIEQMGLLLAAGTEPQLNLIANALRLLLSDDRFAGELSGGSLPVQDALDEVLWSDPPMANFGTRFVRYDVEVGGVRLRRGDAVLTSYAAANTDPQLTSGGRLGNRAHLAWSVGSHRCPAESPSRVIASVAIEKLLDRLPDVELAVPAERLAWRTGPFHRALVALPVRFPVVAGAGPVPAPMPTGVPAPAPAPAAQPSAPAAPSGPFDGTGRPEQPESGASGPRRLWGALGQWWRGQ